MSTVEKLRLTEEEYLQRERAAEFKSEFYRGETFAMAGASREHNLIVGNLTRALGNALDDRDCEVYPNDMRVKVSATGLYTYPDVVIACSKPRFEDQHFDTLTNPIVLVEILSDSTESYDRGAKSAQYRQIPSLREYALVSQTAPVIEVYQRQPDDRWLLTDVRSLDGVLTLASLEISVPLSKIYQRVDFDAPAEAGAE
ncbi:MAG: Uma2 family endonuclease [Planctomycetaceae bacterium]